VADLIPSDGPAAGGNQVTIFGSHFSAGATVKFGASNASGVSVHGSGTIVATAPAGTAGTTVDVTVTTPDGTSATGGTGDNYTYDSLRPPTVTGLIPAHGPAGGGNQVTIVGADFGGATVVSFGGTPATNVNVATANAITVNAPAGTPATTVDVTVTTAVGTSSIAGTGNDYTYDVAPALASLNPLDTFFTKHPRHRTHKRKVTFAFDSNVDSARFQCFYAQGWSKCRSPHTFRHLAPGRYLFKVRAIANGVKDRTPANFVFRILR
jgi:hypothetical protein